MNVNLPFKLSSPWIRWIALGLIIIAICWFSQQIIVKPIVETVATNMIGTRVTMGSFSLNLFTQRLHITDIHIYNEEGFPQGVFFSAPEILIDVDLPQAIKGKLHFPLIIFRLDKVVIFKNAKGQLNVDELKIVKEKLHEKSNGPTPNFQIDTLKLSIGDVIVKDDSKTPPMVLGYNVNLKDKTVQNINNPAKLVSLLMVETLKPTALASAGFYAATTVLGAAFLPGLALGLAILPDSVTYQMPKAGAQVYQKSLELIKRLGHVKSTNEAKEEIAAKLYDVDVSIQIQDQAWNQSKIMIKARKYLLPKPEIARGLLYQIKEELK